MPRAYSALLSGLLWAGTTVALQAHPIPDVPVRASFEEAGKALIKVEVDPRCFDADPDIAPSLCKKDFEPLTVDQRQVLLDKARAFMTRTASFSFAPGDRLAGSFEFAFTGQNDRPLVNPDDVVVLTGVWKPELPAGTTSYQLHALPEGKLSVLFLTSLWGKEVERIGVLFPGESSYVLDLTQPKPATTSAPQPEKKNHGWLAMAAIILAAAGIWWGTQV